MSHSKPTSSQGATNRNLRLCRSLDHGYTRMQASRAALLILSRITVLFTVVLGIASPASAGEARPNVVLILGDDQAWSDYGFMGHPEIRTPALDRLAGRSLVFEHGYVAAPLCRPSLASMVTGLFPFQHGVVGNDVNGKDTTEYKNLHIWDTVPARLYRIREDPREKKDLAAERPEEVERIKGLIETWRRSDGD